MSEYKIELGIGLRDGDFESIQSKIKSLEKDTIKIKLDDNTIDIQLKSIETRLRKLDGIKIDLGNSIGFDSNVAIKSAQQVGQKIGETVTKTVKQSVNVDDVIDKQVANLMKKFAIEDEKGSKPFEAIKQALIECRNELNTLKNGNFSIDEEVFGNSAAIDKVTKAIAKQMSAVNDLGDEYIKLAEYVTKHNGKVQVPSVIKQEQGDDYRSNRSSLNASVFTTGKGQDFADFVTERNGNLGQTIDLTKGEAEAFDELLRKVQLGRQQIKAAEKSEKYFSQTMSAEEILAQNGVSREEIYDDTMSAINAVNAAEKEAARISSEAANTFVQAEKEKQQASQKTADVIQSVSKQTSLIRDDIDFQKKFTSGNQSAKEAQQYFQNLLAEEKAVVSVKESFDNSIGDDKSLKSFTVSVQRASGEVEKFHYAMSETDSDNRFLYQGGSVSDSNVEKQLEARIKKANDLQIQLDKIKTGYSNLGASKPIKEEAHIQSLADQYDVVQAAIEDVKNADNVAFASMESNAKKEIATLESLVKVYRDAETFSTDLRAKDRDAAKEVYSSRLDVLSSKMRKDGVYAGLETDVSDLKTKISGASDVKALSEIANELTKLDAKYKSAKAARDEFNRSQNVGSSVSGLKSDIEILQNASPSIKSFKTEINGAEVSIETLLKDLDQVGTKGDFDVVKGKVEAFGKAAEASGIDLNEAKAEAKRVNDAYKQMLETQKQIRSLSIKEKNLTELGNTNELNEVSAKLKTLKSDYETLKRAFDGKLTSTQFGTLQAEIDETESELKQLDAKWADTRVKLAKSIKVDIENGSFENQIDVMRSKFNSLSEANDELRRSYEATEDAYTAMTNAAKANSGDEVADRERLIQVEKEYAAALEKTNNLIKQQARKDDVDNDSKALGLKAKGLSLDMDNWLKDNSAAAKQFGDAIRELQVRLESCNDVEFGNIKSEFQNIKKEAKALGLTTKTVGDKLKQQFAQYSAYLGVAEIFMWVEQGLRSMYDAVVEIDTAMTGLYRVTDLTSAEYDSLFSNMIDSAKEYGATLNDIINATSDWVRAGFDADTALGLAEVTTMYQHISDLDYDTASENLITAYNGFKDELNGLFGGDEVAAVNYIADVLNELDNNYAATSAGIGEALTRSASALDLAGNSIQETAG